MYFYTYNINTNNVTLAWWHHFLCSIYHFWLFWVPRQNESCLSSWLLYAQLGQHTTVFRWLNILRLTSHPIALCRMSATTSTDFHSWLFGLFSLHKPWRTSLYIHKCDVCVWLHLTINYYIFFSNVHVTFYLVVYVLTLRLQPVFKIQYHHPHLSTL